MKLLLMLCGLCCLFLGARGQGYKKPLDMAHRNLHRRQLTPAQQTHILSDIQQHHHHRFNPPPHSPQQQFLIQQQPSLELSVAPTQRTVVNQRLPPSQQSNGVRFPQNNFRNVQSPQNLNNQQLVQHHTQTNFVPNYAQQTQQLPQQQQQQNAQFQRSLQNQLQTPQQNYQAESAAVPQSGQPIPDQDFHAQNFITLRNHYAQTGQNIPSSSNQQFVQQQPQQQQQQQFQAASQFSNAPFQGSQPLPVIPQQPIVPQSQVLPQVQTFQQPQVQTLQQTQGIQQSPVIPQASAVPTPQQIPFFQNNYQQNSVPQSQFSAASPQQQQQIPFNNNQFQNSQYQQQLQQFQNQQQQQQFQSNIPFQTAPQIPGSTLLTPEQEAKQKLIQKHEAFVQKQYEKQQTKVKQLHDEFVQKQQTLKDYNSPRQSYYDQTNDNTRSRPLQPTEAHLFEHALRKYNEEHPTSPPPTTTTSKIVRVSGTEDPFERLLQAHRKDIYGQLKLETEKPKTTKQTKSRTKTKALGRDELLKQLRLALAETPQSSLGNKTYDSMDVTLPNGQQVQVIRTTDPNLIAGSSQNHIQLALNPQQQQTRGSTTSSRRGESKNNHADSIKNLVPSKPTDFILPSGEKIEISPSSFPSSANEKDIANLYSQSLSNEAQVISSDGPPSIEELARRGLIPEGYEIIQQPAPGSKPAAASQPKTAPPPAKKKPTFVYLEEQSDGTFKIQGVKTNGEKEAKTSGAEVQSILERIQKGEIQLPPSVTKVELPSDDNVRSSTTRRPQTTPRPQTTTSPPQTTPRGPTSTVPIPIFTIPSSTVSPYSTLTPLVNRASTANLAAASNVRETTLTPTTSQTYYTSGYSSTPYSTEPPSTERLIATTVKEAPPPQPDLIQILKINGLFAMAKYLKQSGLDSILNETGPYTVFAPTDKAFKNLLIQLGGPERAEEKFKANPRLLSGLLLHHVIPGSFEIATLQDEMTGVSLAGTQLRVNQYTMHDQEWNDVLITTINGAMVVTDKQDIKIPQGIAHGVDRVMFPLPVGDLLQTLQSDRENRFTNFLKILYTSGMSEILQNKGTKTYTVFAPTDKAFSELGTAEELDKLQSDKEAAQTFAMRHIVPGTLFSAGMRFYQVKDSLYDGKAITLQKTSAGKIKVNDAQMITSNIPATNGVIHALDGLL